MQFRHFIASFTVLLAASVQRLNAQGAASYTLAYTGGVGTVLEPIEVCVHPRNARVAMCEVLIAL